MKLVTFTMLAVLLSVGYAFAGGGTPAPRTGESQKRMAENQNCK